MSGGILTDDAGGFALGMQDEKAFDGFFIAGLFLGASTTRRDLINTRSLEHFQILSAAPTSSTIPAGFTAHGAV